MSASAYSNARALYPVVEPFDVNLDGANNEFIEGYFKGRNWEQATGGSNNNFLDPAGAYAVTGTNANGAHFYRSYYFPDVVIGQTWTWEVGGERHLNGNFVYFSARIYRQGGSLLAEGVRQGSSATLFGGPTVYSTATHVITASEQSAGIFLAVTAEASTGRFRWTEGTLTVT